MDTAGNTFISTPSTKSSGKSSQSSHVTGEPKPPIAPPRRRSSLGFSQVVLPDGSPKVTQQQPRSNDVPVPSLPTCQTPNIGKKRGCITPLRRSKPTPGHCANMQKIFQDAKAHLQLDVAFASSPIGSIDSRLPPSQTPSLNAASRTLVTARQEEMLGKTTDWRYSTAPGLLAKADVDVREPFPENEPLLPDIPDTVDEQRDTPVAEPLSSGFNSPKDIDMTVDNAHNQMNSAQPESPMPEKFIDLNHPKALHPSSSPSQQTPLLTDLEGPLTDLNMNRVCQEPEDGLNDISEAIAYLQNRSFSSADGQDSGEESGSKPIFLSTPARAAAESARAKRGLQRSGFRCPSDKENVAPTMLCPDPSQHTDRNVSQCPNPRRHTHRYSFEGLASTPTPFSGHTSHFTPNPYLQSHQPSPCPLRASIHPPAPIYRRADSRGSPLPVLKLKSPPHSPRLNTFHQPTYVPLPSGEGYRHSGTIRRPAPTSILTTSTAEHFQPGWYDYQPREIELSKPKSFTYAFSTAAAKVIGSSPAPDQRIRDSYRTDTLTPLARPPSRYRKNGIGAIASRGTGRAFAANSYSPWPSIAGPGNGRFTAGHPSDRRGFTNPNVVPFMSSPPRQSDYSACMPTKERRPKGHSKDFDIAEDETVSSIPATPMEIDEDIQAAIRMSLTGVPNDFGDENDNLSLPVADIRQLSPNVSPFRKGRGPRKQKIRTASYWDQDLPEVRRIDQTRKKRPATVDAGTPRVKSMRISGIRSSPPRPMTGNTGTVASASVYSQAGLSDLSRPSASARGWDNKIGTMDGIELIHTD